MPKNLTLKESFDKCSTDGNIILQDNIDIEKIRSMIIIASDDLESARLLAGHIHPKYGSIYKMYYSVIHQLAEALLLFDKVKSYNHHCLFAYLCIKHPELDMDWNFFEKIRTKRNSVEYYGNQISGEDWKGIRFQIELYIKTLSKAIDKRLIHN